MKTLPAIISIATVAVLLLLAVAASVIDSLPFAYIASYVVGCGCAAGLLAFFIADYGPRSPRLIEAVIDEAKALRDAEARAAAARRQAETPFDDHVTVNWLSSGSLSNDPATVSQL
jgi:hypothetical protein